MRPTRGADGAIFVPNGPWDSEGQHTASEQLGSYPQPPVVKGKPAQEELEKMRAAALARRSRLIADRMAVLQSSQPGTPVSPEQASKVEEEVDGAEGEEDSEAPEGGREVLPAEDRQRPAAGVSLMAHTQGSVVSEVPGVSVLQAPSMIAARKLRQEALSSGALSATIRVRYDVVIVRDK